ncbi:unnamed protein product [Adineta steineri]|uniref:NHL repeat containing protein n=2 Tax=Adineta steineri TaxID=433720 RepID=A0A815FN21_9BILA|nr:unnamed protein product [Adineta steineri]CAF3995125.1 unnamed protein product [Adineta steineri]
MITIRIHWYIISIILSITVQVKSQLCRKTPQYGPCSTNSACGCFHMVGSNDDAGVCGFLWPTCYRLVPCNSSGKSCQSNTICVRHPECDDRPLCYPVEMIDQTMCPPMQNMINSKWKQNGITIVGQHGSGNRLNQLFYPVGIFVDDEKTIYIVDSRNHRIVEWKFNSANGQIIAGTNREGSAYNQLNVPENIIFDKNNNSLIICDGGNRRVIQWLYQNGIKQRILISNIDCYGLAIDKNGFLYISDLHKDEVRQWKEGDVNGRIVAGGNGRDQNSHRVVKWRKDAKQGIIVAGGNGEGNRLDQFSYPQGVIVDHSGQIYVADMNNHRVMRWREGNDKGEIVVGGNGQGRESNQLNGPTGLTFDGEGNLYVADYHNHRVQKFLIDI